MATQIHAIGTALPQFHLPQAKTRDFFIAQAGMGRLAARLIGAAFDQSAIDSRYTVLGDLAGEPGLFVDEDGQLRAPSTGERNAVYRREAPPLFAAAARDALARADVDASEVTHVVTASCTGFFAPGPDFLLVKQLGISPNAERTHVGFMGCAAAFPALRVATRISESQPDAVVLVVCAELCSLHIRSSQDPEQIVASAVFADGAAAAVVSAQEPRTAGAVFDVGAFSTSITADGEQDMDWSIGDQGFDMRLTAEVPRVIGREIAGVVRSMLGEHGDPTAAVDRTAVDAWAVHPGGRSVLDRVQASLELPDERLAHSRAVLRDHGNMSSATVLFILRRILEDDTLPPSSRIAALAFGPGLTVETALLTRRVPRGSGRAAA
ncbi:MULTISPECIES: type III polyketide synthase [unclassified Leucobacter]|uniref:type III polyketide synthase n=1 Tax=unclassified Leucobacter TaxID=2621730 RepID=UPI00165DB1F8|nr:MULTISPECIES: type III polyketide synthase [unclassified Leucobacter]MBC9927418.1 type III polyketide synthase [Leucobacter sp. cx-169]